MARYDIDKRPQSLAELAPMILAAQRELSALCNGKRFRMSIPVDDADSDMVIGDALRHSLAFVRASLGAVTGEDYAVDPAPETGTDGLRATEPLSSPTVAPPQPAEGGDA
jgi:hypothetical protein